MEANSEARKQVAEHSSTQKTKFFRNHFSRADRGNEKSGL
jgi:hypothetical protein